MRTKRTAAIGAAALVGLFAVVLIVSPGIPSAEDDPGDLALSREYLKFHALAGGYAEPEESVLQSAAHNLIPYCRKTPIAEMPRGLMKLCDGFDDYKAARARWDWYRFKND